MSSGMCSTTSSSWCCCSFVATGAVPVITAAVHFVIVPMHAFFNHYGKAGPYFRAVAVMVPAWNEGAVIGATIERLLALEYPPEQSAHLRHRRRLHRRHPRHRQR